MNPFISTYDLKEFEGITTLLCVEEGSTVLCSIPNSFQFTVPISTKALVKKVQSLSLSDSSKIICYDKGELITASKVFWSLKAAGFENIYILLGGIYLYHDLGLEVTNYPVPEVPIEDTNYLPFNNSILKIDSQDNPKSSYCQKIRADTELHISSARGKLLEIFLLKDLLINEGIKWKPGKALQVSGKYAPVAGAVFLAIGEKSVSVLLDEKERKYLSSSKSVLDFDADVGKAYSVHENTPELCINQSQVKPVKRSARARTTCGNCIIN